MQCNSVTPFLWMNGTAGNAAEFFTSVFEYDEILSTMPGEGD